MDDRPLEYILSKARAAVGSVDEGDRELLLSHILNDKKIFIYGSGRSGLVSQLFAVRLVQMGLDVHFVGDMTTPIIGKGDLTIIVSNTGGTISGSQTANIARRIGSYVIAVTSRKESKLAYASDSAVIFHTPRDADTGVLAPLGTVFEDSVMLFFDSLVPEIMSRLGVTEADMRARHAIWV